jgi:alkylated DNA repair protein alkB family protein 6
MLGLLVEIAEYLPGDGIMAHSDGPLYHGLVAILSTCEAATMVFKRRLATDEIGTVTGEAQGGESASQFSLVLRPRSLLVFTEEAYSAWLHEIPARDIDVVGEDGECINAQLASVEPGQALERQAPRISLTVRHVPPPAELTAQTSRNQA